MLIRILATATTLALLTGCGPGLSGSWTIEVTDADDCTMELEIDTKGDDAEGEADVECRLFFQFYDELVYYDMEADGVDITGDWDKKGGDFEIEIEFYDDFFEDDVEITLEGELDGDDIEGDVMVDGDDFGEFEGERD